MLPENELDPVLIHAMSAISAYHLNSLRKTSPPIPLLIRYISICLIQKRLTPLMKTQPARYALVSDPPLPLDLTCGSHARIFGTTVE
jgi:hypothetical protein